MGLLEKFYCSCVLLSFELIDIYTFEPFVLFIFEEYVTFSVTVKWWHLQLSFRFSFFLGCQVVHRFVQILLSDLAEIGPGWFSG